MILTTASEKTKGRLAAWFTMLVWGSTFIATKVLLGTFQPVEIILFRFVLGFAFLWLLRPKRLPVQSWKTELLFALAGLTGVCLNYLLETFALLYTQASNLAVIVSTAPLFTGLLAMPILHKKLSWRFGVGFLAAFAGVFFISFPEGSGFELHLIGDLLGVAIAAVWAVYSIIGEKLSRYGFDVALTTRRTFFYGILFMLPFAAFEGVGADFALWLQPEHLALLLYLGIIACAITYITWNYAVQTLGSVESNLYFYAQPVITVLFALIFLHERITPLMAVGMVLTLAGLALSEN